MTNKEKPLMYGCIAVIIVLMISLNSFCTSSLAKTEENFKGVYYRSMTSDPWIALTFDDGPHKWYTPRILEILKKLEAKATFFLVGKLCIRHPDLVRQISIQGHSIGNHTFNHWNMTRLDFNRALFEWKACSEAIENATGKKSIFCRPAGGKVNENVIKSAVKAGMVIIKWNINSLDCSGKNSVQIRHIILSRLKPGSIILLHDGFESTIEALPDLIGIIRKKGYKLVTLDEMFYCR